MNWDLKADRPIYAQLIEQITYAIISGIYRTGDKLPSVRDLAEDAAVNPNTMQKALAELERSGLVFTQRTAGRYITEDSRMIEQVKSKLAREQLEKFLEHMQSIGITRKEIIALIEKEESKEAQE